MNPAVAENRPAYPQRAGAGGGEGGVEVCEVVEDERKGMAITIVIPFV